MSSTLLEQLARVQTAGLIRPLDLHLGRLLGRMAGAHAGEVALAACLASRRSADGDVCLSLAEVAGRQAFPEEPGCAGDPLTAPPLEAWRVALSQSGMVGPPGGRAPLILAARDRLYLARYWRCETDLAERLLRLMSAPAPQLSEPELTEGLSRLFPASAVRPDWQKLATALAVLRPLALISGGPGTGKTRTVVRILALLIEQAGDEPIRIALAAPTGKAAARLGDSIKSECGALPCAQKVKEAIPLEASTIHRLLGVRWGRAGFRHDAGNPLHVDVLVVDEASMVDLTLMARLVDALPPEARLVLLGDRDQLASVAAGSVLGDICAGAGRGFSSGLSERLSRLTGQSVPVDDAACSGAPGDSTVVLRHSYRFAADSGIGRLAAAVNAGDCRLARELVADPTRTGLCHRAPVAGELVSRLEALVLPQIEAMVAETDPTRALLAVTRFRVLCAVREGPFGVERINSTVETLLARRRRINPRGRWYAGRPVMVTRNDQGLGLFNGDVGIILRDPAADGRLRAFFAAPGGGLRRFLPGRLPAHETVYAMTVHKSQGSEFDRVLLVLPRDDSRVVTRELLYTGITRARLALELWCPLPVLEQGVARPTRRASGLRERLWASAVDTSAPPKSS